MRSLGAKCETDPAPAAPEDTTRHAGAVRRTVERLRDGVVVRDDDWIAAEIPLALHYNGQPHVVMMATPADLEDFALGFSLSEAVIVSADELESIEIRHLLEGIEISVRIPSLRAQAVAARQRNLSGRSSCGLCGTQQLEDVVRHPSTVALGPRIDRTSLHRALAALTAMQPLNALTGAIHAAAWADTNGDIVLVREDVGRHNALDKLIGAMAVSGADPDAGFLVLTSRASYEMVQKAASIGITLVVAISAPTAFAIHLADSTRVTLIGFARADSCVIYTHPHRISDNGI